MIEGNDPSLTESYSELESKDALFKDSTLNDSKLSTCYCWDSFIQT